MRITDTTFKDDSPKNTVKRIKGILQEYGIKTEEKWNESGVPNCYSLRVSVFGTVFGTNGKGVTEELALASGYGELMERLQLGRIFKADRQKDAERYTYDMHDGYFSAQELLKKNRNWYSRYIQAAKQRTGTNCTEEALLEQYKDANGKIPCTSFCEINTQSEAYLPTALVNAVYTTNGCAAGNTMEEALVQAISEIVERHVSLRVLQEGIPVPDMPEEVLQSFPVVSEIIGFLRENGFRVVVKDCSLGTKFPVVCVCLVDTKTGRYHTHFGAFPRLEIALQRTLTETFQGRNIRTIARFDKFQQKKEKTFDIANIMNQLVKGTAEKSVEFFLSSAEKYENICGFSNENNRELLKECVDFFAEQGYDILVRDYSCLGFPTYQVIIPGYSEIYTHRLVLEHDDTSFGKFGKTVLRDPSAAELGDIMGFMMDVAQTAKKQSTPKSFSSQTNLPANLTAEEERYYMSAALACVNYKLGRLTETTKYIDKMLEEKVAEDEGLLICLKRYLLLQKEGYDADKIRAVLEYFHRAETVQKLFDVVSQGENPLDLFALRCNLRCEETCVLYQKCLKKSTDVLAGIIYNKQKELDNTKLAVQLRELLTDN